MNSNNRFFLGKKKLMKQGKNTSSEILTIPLHYFHHTGLNPREVVFNVYADIKTNELILQPIKKEDMNA